MRNAILVLLAFCGWVLSTGGVSGAEFRLINGDVIQGEPVSYNDDGVVFRLEVGGHTPRINWGRFSQESLKALAAIPQAKTFAEPFIEIPPEVKAKARAERRKIVLKDVPRVERVAKEQASLGSLVNSPAGLALLIALFLGNLYAAYEIALYRLRPPALVCGVSALLPVIGPILFLVTPPAVEGPSEAAAVEPDQDIGEDTVANPAVSSSLAISETKHGAAKQAQTMHFKRSDTTFNRRFFEVTFNGFFRVVPTESEKDLVLVIKSMKGEVVGKRISRISMNEVHLQTLRGSDVGIGFSEITEVLTRHKDAKS